MLSDHRGEEELGEVRERGDVHLNHRQLGRDIRTGELARQPVSGVVHQELHLEPGRLDATRQLRRSGRIGQIRCDHRRLHIVAIGELVREGLQPILTPGDEHDIVPIPRE